MRAFKFNLSFYLLPVFFFVLAVSPNISGDRIGQVLFSVFVLLIPASNYLSTYPTRRSSDSEPNKYSFIDYLALFLFLAAIYLGWKISWQFNLLQGLFLVSVLLFARQEKTPLPQFSWFLAKTIQGMLLFAVIYIGLNQYGYNNLLRIHILLFAFLSIIIVLASLFIANLREYYLQHTVNIELKPLQINIILIAMLWLFFAGFLTVTYSWYYAAFITLAILPTMVLSGRLFNNIKGNKPIRLPLALLWLNIILASSLVVFFIYFFLDSTQVLQAILGGY